MTDATKRAELTESARRLLYNHGSQTYTRQSKQFGRDVGVVCDHVLATVAADEGNELVDEDFIRSLLPPNTQSGRRGHYIGTHGWMGWSGMKERGSPRDFVAWINGEIFDYQTATREQFRQLMKGLNIALQPNGQEETNA